MAEKPYRCRPSLNKSIVVGSKLADLDGTFLQFFNINDHTFVHSREVLQKVDQYCARLTALSPSLIVIFGASRFLVFDIEAYKVVQEVPVEGFIENADAKMGYVYTLTTEEDG